MNTPSVSRPQTRWLAALLLGLSVVPAARAQLVVQEDFNVAQATMNWVSFNGACLTAGTTATSSGSSIPACQGLAYYKGQTQVGGYNGTFPDPAGNGALRFNNGYTAGQGGFNYGYNQSGGLISNFTFPSTEGIQVTFTAVSYRGDSGGSGGDGADGISFFLMDGSYSPYDVGAFGGSLGYTCSNANNDGTTRTDGTQRGYDGLAGYSDG